MSQNLVMKNEKSFRMLGGGGGLYDPDDVRVAHGVFFIFYFLFRCYVISTIIIS